ncbi:hypothetical protein PR202_gb24770 [Eleusine coracana subsp. coracana]|uniref:Uncharacterized protein n=1 Tax=Eleusine coracana subsp. coracana TaxID=191504 RepID=A0AAV5FMV3_ELECO|nr:hypothetical protein PR202_gb24770 [Eleusine coracana subsp. coracana]
MEPELDHQLVGSETKNFLEYVYFACPVRLSGSLLGDEQDIEVVLSILDLSFLSVTRDPDASDCKSGSKSETIAPPDSRSLPIGACPSARCLLPASHDPVGYPRLPAAAGLSLVVGLPPAADLLPARHQSSGPCGSGIERTEHLARTVRRLSVVGPSARRPPSDLGGRRSRRRHDGAGASWSLWERTGEMWTGGKGEREEHEGELLPAMAWAEYLTGSSVAMAGRRRQTLAVGPGEAPGWGRGAMAAADRLDRACAEEEEKRKRKKWWASHLRGL